MREEVISNAQISRAFLGKEDHGFLTANLDLDFGGMHQGFGGFGLSANAGEYLTALFAATGCESWEGLRGKPVRAYRPKYFIRGLGHSIEDKWAFIADEKWQVGTLADMSSHDFEATS